MPDGTMREAALELHKAIVALRELLEREYPSRREVERRFQSKHKSTRRWYMAIVLILVSTVLSFLGTVTTVSTCFLGDAHHPQVCNLMPGYQERLSQQERLQKQFKDFTSITERNRSRIRELERRQ